MPYAVELYFDMESTKKIEDIRTKLKENGIGVDEGTKPHVSIAIYENLDIETFRIKLQKFSYQRNPLDIILASIGIFASECPVVFLAPIVTSGLLKFHKEFHEFFKELGDSAWDYYRPEKWVPHCTLAMNIPGEMVSRAVELARHFALPIYGTLQRVGVIEFSPNKQLFEYDLYTL